MMFFVKYSDQTYKHDFIFSLNFIIYFFFLFFLFLIQDDRVSFLFNAKEKTYYNL